MTVDELRQAIKALPPLPEAERFTWLFRRKDLRRMMLEANPEEFLTWPVVKECCFVGNAPYISEMLDHIYSPIADPMFGKPELLNGFISGSFVLQNYHLQQVLKNNLPGSIVEFGAGYGAMAYICRERGFRGSYTIVDLPEFSWLQKYYLFNTLGSDPLLQWHEGHGQYDLLIAICSLSEIDVETRNSFLERVRAKSYLIVFQPQWNGIDNMKYFTTLMNDNPQLEWRMYPNPHYSNHWYLIGK